MEAELEFVVGKVKLPFPNGEQEWEIHASIRPDQKVSKIWLTWGIVDCNPDDERVPHDTRVSISRMVGDFAIHNARFPVQTPQKSAISRAAKSWGLIDSHPVVE